jgi:hypothetical protein
MPGLSAAIAASRAVSSGSRNFFEEQIELGKRTAAHEGERAPGALAQLTERFGQFGRDDHIERGWREIE